MNCLMQNQTLFPLSPQPDLPHSDFGFQPLFIRAVDGAQSTAPPPSSWRFVLVRFRFTYLFFFSFFLNWIVGHTIGLKAWNTSLEVNPGTRKHSRGQTLGTDRACPDGKTHHTLFSFPSLMLGSLDWPLMDSLLFFLRLRRHITWRFFFSF